MPRVVWRSLAIILAVVASVSQAGKIGAGLGFGKSSEPHWDALNHLKGQGFYHLKTWSINPGWLDQVESVYGSDDVSITVAIPNGDLWKVNGDQGYVEWVLGELTKHRRIIKLLAIGNEPFHEGNRPTAMPHLKDAYVRMVQLLAERGLQNEIKVTIPFSAVILVNTSPPEASEFHPEIIGMLREIAPTMQSTGSKFSINLYPYFAHSYDDGISLELALGSLFELMLRGSRVALDKIGANSLPIIVGETGWPSEGGKGTTVENERTYVQNIINFANSNNLAETIYIFEAFDESEKGGAETERHFGIGYENRQAKFSFDLGGSGGGGGGGGGDQQPCTEWGWRFYDNKDIEGNDLGVNIPAGHRNDCQQPCRDLQGCKGYSWFQNVCYMKSGGSTFKPSNDVYSAILC